MNKKIIVYLVIITILLIVIFVVFNRCTRTVFDDESIKTDNRENKVKNEKILKYDLNEAPIKYRVDTSKGEKEYFEYLKQYIKPTKLLNFISEKDLFWPDLYYKPGNEMLRKLSSEAYQHLFESMFEINRTNFNDCAVTKKFLEKFNTNLNDYFDIGGEENWGETYTTDKIIKVTKRWNILMDGEAEYAMLYRFKYTLDEDGNVDDVILEHIGWD